MHVCNEIHVLIVPFLLHVLALITPSSGRTFLCMLKPIVTFCDYNDLQLLYSYLNSYVCFIVELKVLKSLCKILQNCFKMFLLQKPLLLFLCRCCGNVCSLPRSILQGPPDRVRRLHNEAIVKSSYPTWWTLQNGTRRGTYIEYILSCRVVLAACTWACHVASISEISKIEFQ